MNKGIVVAGSMVLDRHYAIDTYPEEGRLVKIRGTHEDVGGSGNLIIDLAKLDPGLHVEVSAVIGTGSAGRSVLRQLSAYPNIDTAGIVKHGHTSMTVVMDALDTHQRTFFYEPGASDIYDMQYISWDALNADIFQLEYLLLMKGIDAPDDEYGTHAGRILAQAQRRGMKTSIDMVSEKSDRVPHIVQSALKYTDYCVINELEATEATGIPLLSGSTLITENRRAVLDTLASYGVSTWVIVHMTDCSFGLDCKTGEYFCVPSLSLPDGYIKGKTGAGDAYCCGVLYAAYKEQNLVQAMQLATACAACSLGAVNGTDAMKQYQSVIELYDTYKGPVTYETF